MSHDMEPGRVRIIPLGGLDEVGMNCCLIQSADTMVMIDCGLTFPDPPGYGIDYVLPDWSWVLENLHKLDGVIITHGHEDHLGALPFFLAEVEAPIWASRLTLGMLSRKLREHNVEETPVTEVKAGDVVSIGGFEVEFIHVNHSIPEALALAMDTPAGMIVFTGDWKLDLTPFQEPPTDLARFEQIAESGVFALLADSTNAMVPGFSRSESDVYQGMMTTIENAPGRVIIAQFSSNLRRVEAICDIAQKLGRKVAFLGRSLENNVGIARDLEVIHINDQVLIPADKIESSGDKVIMVTTGSQAEPRSSLTRMAWGDHHLVTLKDTDTVIHSARMIPGNENPINQMFNAIARKGARIVTANHAPVHASGHAMAGEITLLLHLLRPKWLIPVHGEFRMRQEHAEIARNIGIDARVIENGDVLEVSATEAAVKSRIPVGRVAVDGRQIADLQDVQLRDRKKLAASGIVVVFAVIDRETGEFETGPNVLQHGFLDPSEMAEYEEQVIEYARNAVLQLPTGARSDIGEVHEALRTSVRRYFRKELDRRPVVIPLVHEL